MSMQQVARSIETAGPARGPQWSGIVRTLSLVCLLALILFIVVPTVPPPVGPGFDPSWIWGLNMAHSSGLIFGPQIVFTMGPLGYLVYPTFPEAEPWAFFAFAWGFGAITAYALVQVIREKGLALAWLYIAIFWLCSIPLIPRVERVTIATVALSLSVALRLKAKPWCDLGLLYFLAALALLIKPTLAVPPLAIAIYFSVLVAWQSSSRGLSPWRPIVLLALSFAAWLIGLSWASNGTLRDLGSYLYGSMEIVNGYSEARALAGTLWVAVLAVASTGALFTLVPLISRESRRMALGFVPLGVLTFLSFKEAMVREDGHCLFFQFELALFALLLLAFADTLRSRIVIGQFSVLCITLGVLVQYAMWPPIFQYQWDRLTGRELVRDLRGFLDWPNTARTLGLMSEQALAPARIPPEFAFAPLLAGKSVAAVPSQIDLIRANHLKWQPLPVMQTDSAYTAALDAMNADQLAGSHAPQEILLSWTSVDGHHPFYESPRTWQELFNHYDLQLTAPDLYVLKHRVKPRFDSPVPAGESETQWRKSVTVPPVGDDEILLMQADIRQSLKGALWAVLLRAPGIYLDATLRSGEVARSRLVRRVLNGGVIVSEWPKGLGDTVPMFLGDALLQRERVASIVFRADVPDHFRSSIRIHWLRLKVPRPGSLPAAPSLRLTRLWGAGDPPPAVLNAELHKERDWLAVKSQNVDPQCVFKLGPDLGLYKTIMIRAKYQVNDRIDLFFGPQINGRGVAGFVPVSGIWIDAYFNVAGNPYWSAEHGSALRFDPMSELGVNTTVQLGGIWGSPDSLPSADAAFFAMPASSAKESSRR